MKQKDIALIVVVIAISAVISYLASNTLFGGPKNRQQKVEVVQPISDSFNSPSSTYFNNQSIDPTQLIQIGNNNNQNPFNNNTQ